MYRSRILTVLSATLWCLPFGARALNTDELPSYIQDVREGANGNAAALDHGLKMTEAALKDNPKDAQAQVWHGVALTIRSKNLIESGGYEKGSEIFHDGLREMDIALDESPDDPRILIPRGATLLRASFFTPPGDETTKLLRSALADYLKAVDKVGGNKTMLHQRLLYGIAVAYARLGKDIAARRYFELVADDEMPTLYLQNARIWLRTNSLTREQELCDFCDAIIN